MSDTNKRDYKIAHYPRENERAIFREMEGIREWLQYDNSWRNEKGAKRYWHESDCISALITIRKAGEINTTSIEKSGLEEKGEKTSWSEL